MPFVRIPKRKRGTINTEGEKMAETSAFDTGELVYYRMLFSKKWVHTIGVAQFCEENKCFWILDNIASYIPALNSMSHGMTVDYLLIAEVVAKDGKAIMRVKQEKGRIGNGGTLVIHENGDEEHVDLVSDDTHDVLIQQNISFTDLKDGAYTIWAICENGTGDYSPEANTVVLMPDEY